MAQNTLFLVTVGIVRRSLSCHNKYQRNINEIHPDIIQIENRPEAEHSKDIPPTHKSIELGYN